MEQKKRKELYKKGKIYGRGWIISTVLVYPMWDDGYSLKDLLEMLQHFFFGQLQCRHHPRWVFSTRVLKATILPRFKRLNSATKITSDNPKTSQTLLLQSLDRFE
jgi:hypothetical protein